VRRELFGLVHTTQFTRILARSAALVAVLAFVRCSHSIAQHATATNDRSWLRPVTSFDLADSSITLRRPAEPEKPFTVAGECGAMMGQQNGSFESWIFPVKLFSHMTIEARVSGYDVPIDVNRDAAAIEVSPDHTTITYSHIAFTLKEILFSTQCSQQDGTGIMALFQVSSIRPVTLTFSFVPEMKRMWPAPISSSIDAEWVRVDQAANSVLNDTTRPGGPGARYGAGWYMLHTDSTDLSAAIALSGSEPGIMQPYQEKPQSYPLQFVLSFDPVRDSGHFFPLLMAVGTTKEMATKASLEHRLAALNENVVKLYRENENYYAHFFDTRTTVETPDAAFDRDLRWAALSIDQARVRHNDEVGMVAGFFSSGSSARPGFGWFFGRDTLFTTWGINSYGDYKLTRQALSFLIHRQRDDGKMPHEYSQTAELVNWADLPYEYAAADATPLFLMAVDDYVTTSGDTAFVRSNWTAIQKAWSFESMHDSDGDGIYDNAQGTGWVESWPQGLPHQEIYLAALDQQASQAMARLCELTSHPSEARLAQQRADTIGKKIVAEYAQPNGMYAFSHNRDGSPDTTATIYPSIAWWSNHYELPAADAMFQRWASHEFSTDWGMRDVGEHESVYDPISYHQGSVWPLFTGWASLAEYRTGRDLAAYTHLMQNVNLTTEQDLGAITELLSGAYYTPFGRSTSHQMWSSAMVLVPALRGLFGLGVDALTNTLVIDPHLPAQWSTAALHHVQIGSASADIKYERKDGWMAVSLLPSPSAFHIKLTSTIAGSKTSSDGTSLLIPLPAVEVGMLYGASDTLPMPGAPTQTMKVLEEQWKPRQLILRLEAQGGSNQKLFLRRNALTVHITVDGAVIDGESLDIKFPEGLGYQSRTVILNW
jgi:glycogen debranching enzyme